MPRGVRLLCLGVWMPEKLRTDPEKLGTDPEKLGTDPERYPGERHEIPRGKWCLDPGVLGASMTGRVPVVKREKARRRAGQVGFTGARRELRRRERDFGDLGISSC